MQISFNQKCLFACLVIFVNLLGNWIAKRGQREQLFIASKIAGPSQGGSHIRAGQTRFTADEISTAIDGSLQRLQSDYIDLYQLHWPQRATNFFGKLGYGNTEAQHEQEITALEETLTALSDEIKKGRAILASRMKPHGER